MSHQRRKKQQSSVKRFWQAHITAHQKSGLSRAEYCRRHKLSYNSMTYWHSKLPSISRSGTALVPVVLGTRAPGGQNTGESSLKITLDGRFSVEVSDHFSPSTLHRVLTVLEGL